MENPTREQCKVVLTSLALLEDLFHHAIDRSHGQMTVRHTDVLALEHAQTVVAAHIKSLKTAKK